VAVLNLSTIAAVVYHHIREEQGLSGISLDAQGENCLNGRYFRQQLGFNDEQMKVFREANQHFQPLAQDIVQRLDTLRNEAFVLLNTSDPDKQRLQDISAEIGTLHAKLKNATNSYYLSLRAVCSPQQAQKLQQAFIPLFQDASCNNPQRRNAAIHPRQEAR
jgi:hypothetical protein